MVGNFHGVLVFVIFNHKSRKFPSTKINAYTVHSYTYVRAEGG